MASMVLAINHEFRNADLIFSVVESDLNLFGRGWYVSDDRCCDAVTVNLYGDVTPLKVVDIDPPLTETVSN
jgi:hypothetical protein